MRDRGEPLARPRALIFHLSSFISHPSSLILHPSSFTAFCSPLPSSSPHLVADSRRAARAQGTIALDAAGLHDCRRAAFAGLETDDDVLAELSLAVGR